MRHLVDFHTQTTRARTSPCSARRSAPRATIGFRAGPRLMDWPIVERKLPTHYDRASGEFKFEDGDGLEVDCVVYCTRGRLLRHGPLPRRTAALRSTPPRAGHALEGDRPSDCTSLYTWACRTSTTRSPVRRAGPLRAGLPRGPGEVPGQGGNARGHGRVAGPGG